MKNAEMNMVELVKQAQEAKKKILLSVGIIFVTIASSCTMFALTWLPQLPMPLKILLFVLGFAVLVVGMTVGCVLDKEAGAYECPNCKHRFVPTMGQYVWGMHTLTRRMLTCPKCKKRSMCKRVLTK